MHTLTLIAQKSGTGKTTLAINLSVAAEASGWRAALADGHAFWQELEGSDSCQRSLARGQL